jgi:hypothetical protein
MASHPITWHRGHSSRFSFALSIDARRQHADLIVAPGSRIGIAKRHAAPSLPSPVARDLPSFHKVVRWASRLPLDLPGPDHRRAFDNGPLTTPAQPNRNGCAGLIMKSLAQEVIGFGMAFALSLAASVVTVEFIRQLMSIPH